MEYFILWLSKFFFAALSLTFRGYEAGLFHAYWVISYCVSENGFWQDVITDAVCFTSVEALSFFIVAK